MVCRRVFILLLGAVACVQLSASAHAQQHTREDANALVNRVSAYLLSTDREQALAAISDPKGEFVSGDLYPFVMDLSDPQLPMLAHGVNKALIGKPQINVKDADGREFNKTSLAIVQESGEGWVEYKWSDPVTHRIRPKSSFVKKVGNYLVGCGIYE